MFSAYNQENEPQRLVRLQIVFAYARGLTAKYPIDLREAVVNLHDHKGDLRVIWRITPGTELKSALAAAWEDFGECNIEHVVDLKAPVEEESE